MALIWPDRSIASTGSRRKSVCHEIAVMWTARIGTMGSRGATGISVRTPRTLPARSVARTVTAAAGGVGKVTEKVPFWATFTSESSTVTTAGSLTLPDSVTGAPRTAGWVGPVIVMSRAVRVDREGPAAPHRPRHERLVHAEIEGVGALGEVARPVGQLAVADVGLVEDVAVVVVEGRGAPSGSAGRTRSGRAGRRARWRRGRRPAAARWSRSGGRSRAGRSRSGSRRSPLPGRSRASSATCGGARRGPAASSGSGRRGGRSISRGRALALRRTVGRHPGEATRGPLLRDNRVVPRAGVGPLERLPVGRAEVVGVVEVVRLQVRGGHAVAVCSRGRRRAASRRSERGRPAPPARARRSSRPPTRTARTRAGAPGPGARRLDPPLIDQGEGDQRRQAARPRAPRAKAEERRRGSPRRTTTSRSARPRRAWRARGARRTSRRP